MIRALACGAFLVGCGGSRTPVQPAPLANAGSVAQTGITLPAHFAALFVAGAKTFPGELIVSHSELSGPVSNKTPGEVTCTVSDVQDIRGGKVCELQCSGLELIDQINGTFVGTERGLWKVDSDFANDVTTLAATDALFSTVPATAHAEHKDPDSGMDSGNAKIVERHAGGWCVMVTSWGGDEGGWQLCLEQGVGIIGGHGFFAGGQSRDAYFGDVRRL